MQRKDQRATLCPFRPARRVYKTISAGSSLLKSIHSCIMDDAAGGYNHSRDEQSTEGVDTSREMTIQEYFDLMNEL